MDTPNSTSAPLQDLPIADIQTGQPVGDESPWPPGERPAAEPGFAHHLFQQLDVEKLLDQDLAETFEEYL